MKTGYIIVAISFLLSLIGIQGYSQGNYRFQCGEEIRYKIFYNWNFVWIPAGEVLFKVNCNQEFYEFAVFANTYPSYDSFFKVDDRYRSIVDTNDLLGNEFVREIHEGNYHRYDSIRFDQEAKSIIEYFGRNKNTLERFEFEMEKPSFDMLGAIYYLRSLDMEKMHKADILNFMIFFDKEFFDMKLEYQGIKTKKIKSRNRQDYRHFSIDLIDGYVFKEGDIMDIWVGMENENIPVMIESPIFIGSVKAILISANQSTTW